MEKSAHKMQFTVALFSITLFHRIDLMQNLKFLKQKGRTERLVSDRSALSAAFNPTEFSFEIKMKITNQMNAN